MANRYEKLVSITSDQETANYNLSDVSSLTCKNSYCQKDKRQYGVGDGVQQRQTLYGLRGNVPV